MVDSPASGPLHALQAELSGTKSQWEALLDRITQGYRDAYHCYTKTLGDMKHAKQERDKAEAARLSFVLSVVTMGFAGGAMSGVVAPWVREMAATRAKQVFAEGMKGVATRFYQQSAGLLTDKALDATASKDSGDAFDPVSPDAFNVYLDKKADLDQFFALVNFSVQGMINKANKESWDAELGQAILDSFRQNCPLLRDAPDPNQLPAKSVVARASEMALWVTWAAVRDWPWWNDQYRHLENNKKWDQMTPRDRVFTPPIDQAKMTSPYGKEHVLELNPILQRVIERGYGSYVSGMFGSPDDTSEYLDLRKLRDFQLNRPNMPFANMPKLSGLPFISASQSYLQLGTKFLDGLENLRPYHKP